MLKEKHLAMVIKIWLTLICLLLVSSQSEKKVPKKVLIRKYRLVLEFIAPLIFLFYGHYITKVDLNTLRCLDRETDHLKSYSC